MGLEELPDLTVEEAAKVFRLSRSQMYEMVRRYRDSGGREGIPVLTFGGRLRITKAVVLRFARFDGLEAK